MTKARAEEHLQTIYSPSGDEIYQVLITDKGQLRIIGHHFGGTSTVTYQTVGFFVSMQPQNTDIRKYIKNGGKGYELRFDNDTNKYVNGVNDNGYITTTYSFPDDILHELFRIYNIPENASGEYNFYVSNIFRVIQYPQGRSKPFVYISDACYSLAEIRAGAYWSTKTYNNLSHYYDMKFTVKRSWVKATPTPTPTKKPTNSPTPTRRPTNTPTNTPHPTSTPTPRPTNTPTPRPTETPTPTPSNTPTPTPFQCKLVAGSDNRKYVQLIEPDNDALPLVIENYSEMNDFYVRILNDRLGTTGNGELKNEIRFPFELYDDTGNIGKKETAIRIPAMTWYEIGDGTHHLYTTSEVKEGVYYLEGRSTLKSSVGRNGADNVIRTDSIPVQISGRLTDLTISLKRGINIPAVTGWYKSGVLNWNVYSNNSVFYPGIRDRYGSLQRTQTQQLPLIVNGPGVELKVDVSTTGKESENGNVKIKTSFHTPDGESVSLYYYDIKPNGSRSLKLFEEEMTMKAVRKSSFEQLWECVYSIPENTVAVASTGRGFYSGPVIANFEITLYSQAGKAVLSYENRNNEINGFCNMWKFQEMAEKIADGSGEQYELLPGDVIILKTVNPSADKESVRLLY